MSELTLYHNPRCSKSRQALALLIDAGQRVKVVEYLQTPPTKDELIQILAALGCGPRDILRRKEAKDEGLEWETMSDEQLIEAMVAHPLVMERPILLGGGRAVVGRPPERVVEFLTC